MATTTKLDLALTSSDEWATKKYKEFILALAGPEGSNMTKIDEAVGALNDALTILDTFLATI